MKFLVFALCAIATYGAESISLDPMLEEEQSNAIDCFEEEDEPLELGPVAGEYDWVTKTAATIPYKCLFVYGGGYNRLLYVGRVRVDGDVLPAVIHHYGPGGTETVHYIDNNEIQISRDISVEWLCAKGRVGWIRVANFSDETIEKNSAIAVGYDTVNKKILYGCMVHSFFSAQYPAALGTIVNGSCVFESNRTIVNSTDFTFWTTLELLVSL